MIKQVLYLVAKLCLGCLLLLGACRPVEVQFFKAEPRVVSIGDSVQLTWKLSKTRSVKELYILDNDNMTKHYPNTIKALDTLYRTPENDNSYTLRVQYKRKGKDEDIKKRVYVKVSKDILMGSDSIVAGEVGQLEWIISSRARNIRLVASRGSRVLREWRNIRNNGLLDVQPYATTSYRLYYKIGSTMRSLEHRLEVKEAMFFATPSIVFGEEVQLIWQLHPKFPEAKIKILDEQQNILKTVKVGNKGVVKLRPESNSSYLLEYGEADKAGRLLQHVIVLQGKITGNKVVPQDETAVLMWRVNPKASRTWIEGKNDKGEQIVLKEKLSPEGRLEVMPIDKQNRYDLCVEYKGKVERYSHFVKVQQPPRPFIKQIKNLSELPTNQKIDMEIFEYDRSNFPKEIRFKVLVTDTKGTFISGLAANDSIAKQYFRKIVDKVAGKSQEIKNFQVNEINQSLSKPYALSLSLDYSGSMWGSIPSLELAVRKLIEQKAADDEVSVVKFDDNLVTKVKSEEDTTKIFTQLRKSDNLGGSTALFAGASEGISSIVSDKNRKTMLLFTDGWDNSSAMYDETHATTALSLVKAARAQGIKIYPISFGQGVNSKVMSAIGVLTDAKPYFLQDESEIAGLYEEFPKLMHNYYEVVYKPIASEGAHITELTFFDGNKEQSTIGQTHVGENYEDPEIYNDATFDPSESSSIPSNNTTNSNSLNTPSSTLPTQSQLPANVHQPIAPKPKHTPQVVALFAYAQDSIEQKYLSKLERVVSYLQRKPESIIEIRGHSDLQGDTESCEEISRKRAEAIRRYLKKQGIEKNRMLVRALGRSEPVWFKEKEEWQKRENRRVEILILERD